MYQVYHEVIIKTTPERCFDLSRSIDFHQASMSYSKEVAVAGKVKGLIDLGEFVEWEATHLMVRQRLSSKITEMVRPHYFVDEMVKGAFKSFRHQHRIVKQNETSVLMIDDFRYETPFGILGDVAQVLFLHEYVKRMITKRGTAIKAALESDQWRNFIHE